MAAPLNSGATLNALFRACSKPATAATHWSRPGVLHLAQALFADDPMGLREFQVPADEYEPEAELALALVFGCKNRMELFALPTVVAIPACDEADLMRLLARSFRRQTSFQVHLDDSLSKEFLAAVRLCSTE